jgi:four helix bundle protein
MKRSEQILRSGTSAPANYEEADDASGKRDELAKKRIALRELTETRTRLRMLRKTDLLTSEHDPVIDESDELVRIVATVIRNSGGATRDLLGIGRWKCLGIGSWALGFDARVEHQPERRPQHCADAA